MPFSPYIVHLKKLRALGCSFVNDSPQVVRNLSHKTLNTNETALLNRGLDFCFYPTKLRLNNVRAEFENVYYHLKRLLPPCDLLALKQKLMSLYGRYVSTFFHDRLRHNNAMTRQERDALQSLRSDDTIVVTKPDKANGVVVMDRSDYVAKMLAILGDTSKFRPCAADDNVQNLTRFQGCLPVSYTHLTLPTTSRV